MNKRGEWQNNNKVCNKNREEKEDLIKIITKMLENNSNLLILLKDFTQTKLFFEQILLNGENYGLLKLRKMAADMQNGRKCK